MPRSKKTTATEILAFLESEGLLANRGADEDAGDRVTISSVRSDLDANTDSLSWISDRVLREQPDRATSFRGALLLAPAAAVGLKARSVVIPCTKPKLAFSRAVYRFFGHLLTTEWPSGDKTLGAGSRVSAKARLAPGVVIGSDCVIEDGVVVGPNSVIANTTIQRNSSVGANCTIGLPGYGYERDESGTPFRFPHLGRVVIGTNVEIGSNTCIDRGGLGDTVIGDDCKIDNLVHIAHNVELAEDCMVIANSMIAGSVKLGRGTWIAPSASVLNQLTVGESAFVGLGAVVIRDVAPHATVVGNPAKELAKRTND